MSEDVIHFVGADTQQCGCCTECRHAKLLAWFRRLGPSTRARFTAYSSGTSHYRACGSICNKRCSHILLKKVGHTLHSSTLVIVTLSVVFCSHPLPSWRFILRYWRYSYWVHMHSTSTGTLLVVIESPKDSSLFPVPKVWHSVTSRWQGHFNEDIGP